MAVAALASPVLAVCMCLVEGGGLQFDLVPMDTHMDVDKTSKAGCCDASNQCRE